MPIKIQKCPILVNCLFPTLNRTSAGSKSTPSPTTTTASTTTSARSTTAISPTTATTSIREPNQNLGRSYRMAREGPEQPDPETEPFSQGLHALIQRPRSSHRSVSVRSIASNRSDMATKDWNSTPIQTDSRLLIAAMYIAHKAITIGD